MRCCRRRRSKCSVSVVSVVSVAVVGGARLSRARGRARRSCGCSDPALPVCSRVYTRLQPCLHQAATVCTPGCNRMYTRLQPYVHQAELQDADGRGMPSAARLQRAMLLATPAVGLAPTLTPTLAPTLTPSLTPSPAPAASPTPNPRSNPSPDPNLHSTQAVTLTLTRTPTSTLPS